MCDCSPEECRILFCAGGEEGRMISQREATCRRPLIGYESLIILVVDPRLRAAGRGCLLEVISMSCQHVPPTGWEQGHGTGSHQLEVIAELQ